MSRSSARPPPALAAARIGSRRRSRAPGPARARGRGSRSAARAGRRRASGRTSRPRPSPARNVAIGQRRERLDVGEHRAPADGTRPTRFLPSGRFTAVLPPIDASDLRRERRRHLHERDAAHVRGRDEPGEIADRAAAERDDRVVPVRLLRGELMQRASRIDLERLRRLALGHAEVHDAEPARSRARPPAARRYRSATGAVGDHERALGAREPGSSSPARLEHARRRSDARRPRPGTGTVTRSTARSSSIDRVGHARPAWPAAVHDTCARTPRYERLSRQPAGAPGRRRLGSADGRPPGGRARASTSSGTSRNTRRRSRRSVMPVRGLEHDAAAARDDRGIVRARPRRAPPPRGRGTQPPRRSRRSRATDRSAARFDLARRGRRTGTPSRPREPRVRPSTCPTRASRPGRRSREGSQVHDTRRGSGASRAASRPRTSRATRRASTNATDRLADDAAGRDRADVGPLRDRDRRLARREVHRRERLAAPSRTASSPPGPGSAGPC